MQGKTTQLISICIAAALILASPGTSLETTAVLKNAHASSAYLADTDRNFQESDIQWFRDQLKISDRYVEEQEGVWGMSWAHFLTMAFLVVFAFGALVVLVQQQRRTKDILETIRKEMENDNIDN